MPVAGGVLLTVGPLLIATSLNARRGPWLRIPLLPGEYALRLLEGEGLQFTVGFWSVRYLSLGANVIGLALLLYLASWLLARRTPMR
jgi:hypothetical protein